MFDSNSKQELVTAIEDMLARTVPDVDPNAVTEEAVVELVDQVYVDIADSFERVGHPLGAALGNYDTIKYIHNAVGRAMVGIGFSNDGQFHIYNDDVVVKSGWWLPYEAVAADYQIRRTGIVGSANAGSTLTTSYGPMVADARSKDVYIDETVLGKKSHTSDIYMKHIPSDTETVFRIHFETNVS